MRLAKSEILLRNTELSDWGTGKALDENEDEPRGGKQDETNNGPLKGRKGRGVGFWISSSGNEADTGKDDHGQSGQDNDER